MAVVVLGGAGCSIGVRSIQGRNPSKTLTLAPYDDRDPPLVGTVDESARSTEISLGGMIGRGAVVVDLGMSLGLRRIGFESPTNGLTLVKPPPRPDGLEGHGLYDAYFTGVLVPVTRVDGVAVGVYGRAELTGLSRLMPGSSGSYDLEAGVELGLPTSTGPNRLVVRVGAVVERASYELVMADDIGSATGSTSFFGLAATIGVRLWKR